MRRHVRASAVLLVLLAGCADHTAPKTTPKTPAASGVSEASVRVHLEFLASDALNGRGSGTRDEQIAAEYVGAQFRRLGFRPGGAGGSYVQTVEIVRTAAAGKPSMTVGALKWTYGKEFVVTALGSPAIAGPLQRLTGPVTDVQRGAIVFLAEDNTDLAGKAVMAGATAVLMRRNLTAAQWDAQAGPRRSARGSPASRRRRRGRRSCR